MGRLFDGQMGDEPLIVGWLTGGLYYALGHAHFWFQGTLCVAGDIFGQKLDDFDGTFQQVDYYTFDTNESAAAALGDQSAKAARDLQFAYGRHPFFNKENWTDSFSWKE